MKGEIRMGIVKKIFESSKSKDTQKKRREFIDELIKCDNAADANKFEEKINNKSEIQKLFGADEKKSDTLKFINRIRDLVSDLKNDETSKGTFIIDLLNGKIPNYKKPSSIATITSKDCKKIAEIILKLFKQINFSKKNLIITNKLSKIKNFLEFVFENLADRFNMVTVLNHSEELVPDNFFSDKKNVIKFIFYGPTTFGKSVFENCDKLNTLSFQNKNITALGKDCFAGCKSLKEIKCVEDSENIIIENIKESVKSEKFNKEVARKLTINGKTVEELKNL